MTWCMVCAQTVAKIQKHAQTKHTDTDLTACPASGCKKRFEFNTISKRRDALFQHVAATHPGFRLGDAQQPLVLRNVGEVKVPTKCPLACRGKEFSSHKAALHHAVDKHTTEGQLQKAFHSPALANTLMQIEGPAGTAAPAAQAGTPSSAARHIACQSKLAGARSLLLQRPFVSSDHEQEFLVHHEDKDGALIKEVKERLERALPGNVNVVLSGSLQTKTGIIGSDVDFVVKCTDHKAAAELVRRAFPNTECHPLSGPDTTLATFEYKGMGIDVSLASGDKISDRVTQAEMAHFETLRRDYPRIERVIVMLKIWKSLHKDLQKLKGVALSCLAERCCVDLRCAKGQQVDVMALVKHALQKLSLRTAISLPTGDCVTKDLSPSDWCAVSSRAEQQLEYYRQEPRAARM